MLLRRFYDDKLAQASWMVGCQATGEAIVIDPNRDAAAYVEAARAEGLEIQHVTETHIHADFVSGTRELSALTGATMYLSDEGGDDWRYGFHDDGRSVRLKDGDVFMVGNVRFEAWHTPGHTPEHMSFVITDTKAADEPIGAFTGDFIFVGDVGRPDLLEKAAGVSGTMEAGAHQLYASLQRFRELPDWLQVWPGHGAGSACGKALGAVPQSTLGYEKRFNWAFGLNEEEFVQSVLSGQPEPPLYFAEMKRMNRDGPRILKGMPKPERQADGDIVALVEGGALVVDTRRFTEFSKAHIPGTLNIPLNRAFPNWAGAVLPYDRPFHLIVNEGAAGAIAEAVHDLAMIGLDGVAGWFGAGALEAWTAAGRATGSIGTVDADAVAAALAEGRPVIDVRKSSEWDAGHLPGTQNLPLQRLVEHLDEVARDQPLILHCQSGSRSAIAASVLAANGFGPVANYPGGWTEWSQAGRATERAEPVAV